MESLNPNHNLDDDGASFFDALDDFPFYDCSTAAESDQSTLSLSKPLTHVPSGSPEPSPTSSLRRRSSRRGISGDESKASVSDSQVIPREGRYRVYPNLNGDEKLELTGNKGRVSDSMGSDSDRHRVSNNEDSTITTASSDRVRDSVPTRARRSSVGVPISDQNNGESTITTVNDERSYDSVESALELGDSSANLLVFIAGLLIKAIGFQINVIISFVTFPIWFTYCSYLFITNPFRTIRRGRHYLIGKLLRIWNLVCENVSPVIYEWFKEQKSILELALQFGWGLFWSIYVCFVLCGLLVLSVVISGFLMRCIVEEPIQMREVLNFDYTMSSPVAYVPISSCYAVGCGVKCKDMGDFKRNVGSRVIPPNHKLRVMVSLTVPESEYNRNLGVFQVRVDFLSANSDILASLSHPCMLKFKSEPIRLLLTFLKLAPLVTGYVSESQTLNLRIRGFTEGHVPTACLKVIMEHRAEYRPGAGVPEIYGASLILESELPLFKRIMWHWRKTIFIWISMISFMMELLFTLVCCRPIILPRAKPRDSSASNNATQNSLSAQG